MPIVSYSYCLSDPRPILFWGYYIPPVWVGSIRVAPIIPLNNKKSSQKTPSLFGQKGQTDNKIRGVSPFFQVCERTPPPSVGIWSRNRRFFSRRRTKVRQVGKKGEEKRSRWLLFRFMLKSAAPERGDLMEKFSFSDRQACTRTSEGGNGNLCRDSPLG